MKKKRILIVEPYYGGSHKHFLVGLTHTIDADFVQMTLPARKWKMRMQLSAPWFVEQFRKLSIQNRWFDIMLCSTFVDVAVLIALLNDIKGKNPSMKYLTYFHENQFVYPGQVEGMSNHQFTAINFTTALASDGIAFNSNFNFTSFMTCCENYLKKAVDMKLLDSLELMKMKSTILYPGMDFTNIDKTKSSSKKENPTILWNHRWEHDKNPEVFFDALYTLKSKGIPFNLIILGQSFRNQPACFQTARKRLREEIIHFGYVDSHEEYASLLKQGDIVVSTSLHEFYGISILEAVRAGCRPLVPNRLSYPELFDSEYLYTDDIFISQLQKYLMDGERLSEERAAGLTDKFQWSHLAKAYNDWFYEQ